MKYHFYRIYIEKKNLYRILNSSEKTVIRNICQKEETVSFDVDFIGIDAIRNLLEKEKINVISQEEFGAFHWFKFLKIKVILTSILISFTVLFINSLFIWNIAVEGNYTYTGEQLVSFLRQNNIKEGMVKSKFNCEGIENLIRSNYSDVSWVSCEMKGTNLIIHLKENYISEISAKETKPYHLISNVSGKIVSIVTRSGSAFVKAGKKVKKGDLLISGKIEIKNESEEIVGNRYCMADGDIMAEVVHKYKDTINKKQIYINQENKKTFYVPLLDQYFLKIAGFDNAYVEKSSRRICLYDNYYLPFNIYKYVVYQDKPKEVEVTEKNASKILNHKMLYYFAQLEQKGYKILKKDVKIVNAENLYTLSGSFTCIEPIGKVEYINIEDTERESSTK